MRPLRSLPRYLLVAAGAVAMSAAAPEDPYAPFVEPGFPFIVSTVDAGRQGPAFPERNLAVRCVILMLGNDTYACFDTDLLRMAVAWRGEFVSLTTMAQISYQQAGNKNNQIPRVLGKPMLATGVYPGWMSAEPRFADPRPAGPEPAAMGRGPIAPEQGRWNGLHVVGNEAVLSYTVLGTDVREQLSSVAAGGRVGVARTFDLGAVRQPLALVVAEARGGVASEADGSSVTVYEGAARDTATVVGVVGAPAGARLQVDSGRYVTLRLPAGAPASRFRVVAWRGPAAARGAGPRCSPSPCAWPTPRAGARRTGPRR
jgi:hypothetical protein